MCSSDLEAMGGSGDPSPFTAYGVYVAMKASANEKYGSDSLKGKKILVQGLGNVGGHLVEHLSKEGAELFLYDINQERVKELVSKFKATAADPATMFDLDIDIYSPCALGATVNDYTLEKLKCQIICGAANNQLEDEVKHGETVMKKGILYAPDYVVNSGGIINVYYELDKYNRDRALNHTEKIYETTRNIFQVSKSENIPTYLAANRLAEKRIQAIAGVKVKF